MWGLRVQATVAYYLMSDNRRRMPSDAYLRAELTEAHDPRHAFPSGGAPPGRPHTVPGAPAYGLRSLFGIMVSFICMSIPSVFGAVGCQQACETRFSSATLLHFVALFDGSPACLACFTYGH